MSKFLPVDNQKPHSVRNFIFSLFTVAILLAALPVGVYLVGQNTNFTPQAATPAPTTVRNVGNAGYSLELKQDSQPGGLVGVDVLIHSDVQPANLFAAKINFPKDIVLVKSVATSSAVLSEWAKASFDNDAGTISLVAGMPHPGLLTESDKKYILATVYFKPKNRSTAQLSFDPASKIFSDSDNTNLSVGETGLDLDLTSLGSDAPEILPTSTPAATVKKSLQPTLTVIAPTGGESFDINQLQTIQWSAANLNSVSVSILMNDQPLGKIASVSASLGQFNWTPKDFIYPSFTSFNNTFKIKLAGIGDKNASAEAQSAGPFGIFINKTGDANNSFKTDGDINSDSKIDLVDLSQLLSNFGDKVRNQKTDMNGDGVVNDVDLWIFTTQFLQNIQF